MPTKKRSKTISRSDIKIRKGCGLMPTRVFNSKKTYTRKTKLLQKAREE